jgi:hypothetical protein
MPANIDDAQVGIGEMIGKPAGTDENISAHN